jgi:uncharacterized membrane protein
MASGSGYEAAPGGDDSGTAGRAEPPQPGAQPPAGSPVPPPSWQATAPPSWQAADWRRAGRRRIGGGFVIGLVLLMIGAYFLVRQVAPAVEVDRLWPYGAVAIGVVLLVAAVVAPER